MYPISSIIVVKNI